MIATLLQLAGIVLLAAGLCVWFGPGPGLVALGVGLTAEGVAVELERRAA